MITRRAVVLGVTLGSVLAPAAQAQSWIVAWSPLRPLGDLPRTTPQAAVLPGLLTAPAPRVGLLWTAGTPAALARDVADTYGDLALAGAMADGDYRRPLDPSDERNLRFQGLGWGPLGPGGSVIGRVVVGQTVASTVPFSVVDMPHGGSPLTPLDSTSPSLQRATAQFEGGIGGHLGPMTAGIAAGVEVADAHTKDAPFVRLIRQTTPGLSAGFSWTLPGALQVAAFGRFLGSSETITLFGNVAPGVAYVLSGYSEPNGRAVTPGAPFYYRIDREAWSAGFAAAGTLWRTRWVLYGERAWRDEAQADAHQALAPTDRWHANTWSLGGAAQRAFGAAVAMTLDGRYTALGGNATRSDLEGDVFRASEHVLDLRLETRVAPAASPWQLAIVLALANDARLRQDFVLQIPSDITGWTSGGGLEIARRFGGTSVAAGYAVGFYGAYPTLPDPAMMGPIYRRVTGPELELYARRAVPMTATLAARQQVRPAVAIVLQARANRLAPSGDAPMLTLSPQGRHWTGDIALGVIFGR